MRPHVQPRTRGGIGPKRGDYTRCPKCIVGGLTVRTCGVALPDYRPEFHCQRCGHSFTSGKVGEPYFSVLKGWALPPGWGIDYRNESKECYYRDDGLIVSIVYDDRWSWSTPKVTEVDIQRVPFGSPLEAMLDANKQVPL